MTMILALSVTDAVACSCATPLSPAKAFGEANEVFEGTVVKIVDNYSLLRKLWDRFGPHSEPDLRDYEVDYGFTYAFEVTRAWRGGAARRIIIVTGRGGGDCGFKFEQGKTYLVYAYCYAGRCGTGICTRTAETSRAMDDYRFLASRATLPLH